MNQRVLITGGAGFIGSHLAEFLLEEGWEVSVLDDLSSGSEENIKHLFSSSRFYFHEGCVLNYGQVESLVNRADVVVHLAASLGVQKILSNTLESMEINIFGTHNVFKAAMRHKPKVLIASTSEVYGKHEEFPLRENGNSVFGATEKHRWSYGVSKAIDEFFALAYWREHKLPTIVVRFFNTVGPRQTGRYGMVIPRLARRALREEPLEVYGDGKQTRCFTDVEDAIRAVYGLINHPNAVGQVFNIGGGIEISIEKLAREIKRLTQSNSPIVYVPYEKAYDSGYEDMRRRVPDITKIKKLIGFEPKVDLITTLQRIIAYQRSVSVCAVT